MCRGDRLEAAPEPGAKKRSFWYPTGDQRLTKAQTLARKVLPDMKAVELAGPAGEPMIARIERVIVDDRVKLPAPTDEGVPRETEAGPDSCAYTTSSKS